MITLTPLCSHTLHTGLLDYWRIHCSMIKSCFSWWSLLFILVTFTFDLGANCMEKLETSHSLAFKNKHQGKESSTSRCFLPLKKHLGSFSTFYFHLPIALTLHWSQFHFKPLPNNRKLQATLSRIWLQNITIKIPGQYTGYLGRY